MGNNRSLKGFALILLTFSVFAGYGKASAAVPNTPSLFYPPIGSNVGGTMISFTWNPVDNVTYYWLQVSTDSNFQYNLIVDASAGSWTNYIYSPFPDIGTTYSWRVKACNDEGCSPYSLGYFTNGPSAPPGTPYLSYPSNNATINGPAIQFQWSPASRATSYTLEIAYDSACTRSYYTYDVGMATSYTPTYPPMPDNGLTYYWRVIAHNSRGSTNSASRSFRSGPSGPPLTPTLYYPDNGDTVDDANMTFYWDMDLSVSYRAADYRLQVATDSAFSNSSLIFDQWIGDDGMWYSLNGLLKNGQQYYWRVKAWNSSGESAFSSYRWFIYDDGFSCTPTTDGRGIGVLNDLRIGMGTCRQDSNHYYLIDTSRRTLPKGQMSAAESIRTKDFHYGWSNVDNDNYWSETLPNYKSSVDAHFYAGQVYDYLYDNAKGWQLNSYNGSGISMNSAVEKTCKDSNGKFYLNASWSSGARAVSYCTGADPYGNQNDKPVSGAFDVVAHEWGHAVTANAATGRTGELKYEYESGALNEAFSDWMAVSVEHFYGKNNWTIGEDIYMLRDLENPLNPALNNKLWAGQTVDFRQPDTYKDTANLYLDYNTSNCTPPANDFCGVHTNSGVPNKMFYLLSHGGTHNNVTVQGLGIQKAMKDAFIANKEEWPADATFIKAKDGMMAAAQNIYGQNSNEVYQVQNAWAAVGVGTLPYISTSASPIVEGGTTKINGGDIWGTFPWGESITVSATPNPGYSFVYWTENDMVVSSEANYSFTVNGNRTLVANFAVTASAGNIIYTSSSFINTYVGEQSPPTTFTVKNSGLYSFTVSNVSIIGDNPQDFTISNTGSQDYCGGKTLTTFASCSVQVKFAPQSAGSKTATLNVQSNAAVNSLLSAPLSGTGETPPTYIITATAGSGGTISPSGSVSITHGQSQTFTITPNTGYHISSVTGCGGTLSGNTYTTGAITANCTVTANFAIKTYTVTPSAGPGGTISPSTPQTVNYNGTKSFTVTPNAGYHIASVTGCGGTLNGNTYTTGAITADCTVTANFALNTYTLTVSKSGSGTVTSAPSGINCGTVCSDLFAQGTTVTLTAIPSQGYTFTGWSGVEGGPCSGNGACTLTINENKTISAVFSQVSQPLDLAFVIDSTGSMWDDIDKVKASAVDIINKLGADVSDYRISVVDYKDHPVSPYGSTGDYPYRAVLPFSKDTTAIVNAINSLTASGGADWPESVYSALINTFNAKDLGAWRPEAKKAIILMGDAPPHDPEPITGYTMNSVIEASYSIASPYASKAGALRATATLTAPVMIYSIVVGSDNNALEYFTKLSEGTEGKVFTVTTSDDVVGGVMDAIDEITTPANRPPVCSSATAATQEIWPPNHNMKSVNIINVADPDGDPVTIMITGISQDEPVKGSGSGNTAPDAEGIGSDTAKVRAERTGSINGRVYKISFAATDDKGLQCTGYVMTCVPHDQGENNVCVDDGQLYDSTSTETEVSLPGNIDKTGHSANRVDGYDLITLSIAFGSKSGDLNWNPSCDLDKIGASNDHIDGNDLMVFGSHFGEVE